tara:strand:- start:3441 stop:3578 length:138 start_codon:yes stop_codon:yes gene_type:complete
MRHSKVQKLLYVVTESIKFHFDKFEQRRDEQILKLNGEYERNWAK